MPEKPPESTHLASDSESRIVICLEDANLRLTYAELLRKAGFRYAVDVSPEMLIRQRSKPGLLDLLICDADAPTPPGDPKRWHALSHSIQPKVGTIVTTSQEDPHWIVKCIRRGAINCHLLASGHQALVELIREHLSLHASSIENIRTEAERQKARIGSRLRMAISEGRIDVHFQPIVTSRNGKCDRVEALARWQDPELGNIPPSQFIPVAEELGFVDELGMLTLRKCLESMALLRDRGNNTVCSINLSRRQFDNPDLAAIYLQTVRDYNQSPSSFIIEVTETAAFENYTLALSVMQDFINEGFRLAVDDFGTGESPFVQMSHISYSELKIDRSLISCVFQPAGLSIMRSLIAMGRELNMHLVAEGVEDKETADLLNQLEIDFCQGYYFARPMPIEELIAFLDAQDGKPATLENSTR